MYDSYFQELVPAALLQTSINSIYDPRSALNGIIGLVIDDKKS